MAKKPTRLLWIMKECLCLPRCVVAGGVLLHPFGAQGAPLVAAADRGASRSVQLELGPHDLVHMADDDQRYAAPPAVDGD